MSAAVPSPFSLLFRRSKFASFDPAISQVYCTHGGDAHRGNWGLKRPLAIRRRTATITVSSVDSRYQQTEWDSGEDQARMVRKMEELDVHIDCHGEKDHSWQHRLEAHGGPRWLTDTEFDPVPLNEVVHPDPFRLSNGGDEELGELDDEYRQSDEPAPSPPETKRNSGSVPTSAVPNIRAMSDKQFDRYVVQLRKLRPQFRAFLDYGKIKGKSIFELAQPGHADRTTTFLSKQARMEYDSPASRRIEPLPHPSAGLMYSHTPGMQTYLTTKPKPGFLCNIKYATRRHPKGASFVGSIVPLSVHQFDRSLKQLTEERVEKDEILRSFGMWRLEEAPWLMCAPSVVGRKRGSLQQVKMEFVITSKGARDNPHLPGSIDYFRAIEESRPVRYNEPRDEPFERPGSKFLEMPRQDPRAESNLMDLVRDVLYRYKEMKNEEDGP